MTYPTLSKFFYADPSSERFANHEAEAARRLNDPSTFRTGIELEHGELFCAVPRELSLASEQVLRRERRVSALWKSLPPAALGAFVRSLILDEVVYSNGIEGVHSTRRQIEEALESANASENRIGSAEREHAPFVEFARLYLGLLDKPRAPQTLEDIREIYDSVVKDAIDERDFVKNSLFRRGPVVIEKRGGRIVHRGVEPEARIEELLNQLIGLSQREDVPELYSAILCHFLFEYIHPFYDGNGRTGRYLLAVHLSRPLSQPTVLTLSRTISEHKNEYYKAFDVAADQFNRSEATHFVLTMLGLIATAQDELIADLTKKHEALKKLSERLLKLEETCDERSRDLLFFAAQHDLFAIPGGFAQTDAAEYLEVSAPTARKTLQSLVAYDLLRRVSQRPARYALTNTGRAALGIGDGDD